MPSSSDVCNILTTRAGLEVISQNETDKQLRLVCRLRPFSTKWPSMALVMHSLLTKSSGGGAWACDISKHFVLIDGKLRYTWRFVFQSSRIIDCYASIVETVSGAPRPARTEIESIALPGYEHRQNVVRGGLNAKGKGASTGGSLPTILTRGRG